MEHGHVLSACQFMKGMNEIQVEANILEAYEGKIPPRVDIEILMSVHNKLLKPTLAPGQDGINGITLHRLFKNKPVYVRPSVQIFSSLSEVRLNSLILDINIDILHNNLHLSMLCPRV